jgi:signal transduction histidine kinase
MSRWLDRAYRRLGPGYIPAVVAAAWLAGLAQLPIGVWLEFQYLDASTSEFLRFSVTYAAVVNVALATGVVLSLGYVLPPYRWLRAGQPAELVPDVWSRAVRTGFVTITRSALAVAVIIIPFHAIAAPAILDADTGVVAALCLFAYAILVTAWLICQLLVDLAYRPVVRDLASHLPSDLAQTPSGWPLRRKALLSLPIGAFYGAFAAGAFIFDATTPETRLYTALAAAAGVTIVFAGPIAAIATDSILTPIHELIAATKRVARADLSTPVPILTDDELGELAWSFNQMQTDLLDRKTLRDRNAELVDALQNSRARIVAASDEARRKVERDLHDGAQQHFALTDLQLGIADGKLERGEPGAHEAVVAARANLERALVELRDLARGVFPSVLSNQGLGPALREMTEQAVMPVSLETNGTGRYRPELEAAVYFCCLEALQNAGRHGGAGAKATVRVSRAGDELRFEVRDDGRGFDPASVNGSPGLQNMEDRIGALGGEVHVYSAPGEGTTVLGSVPIRESAWTPG